MVTKSEDQECSTYVAFHSTYRPTRQTVQDDPSHVYPARILDNNVITTQGNVELEVSSHGCMGVLGWASKKMHDGGSRKAFLKAKREYRLGDMKRR